MTSKRNCFNLTPLTSPSLQGFDIDANVCRNPGCENFGLSQEQIPEDKFAYKYSQSDDVTKYQCKRCKQSHTAYSNRSLLEIFHRYLEYSIPYATCPNIDCQNYYLNIFEYYFDDLSDKREKRYRINVNDDNKRYYQAKCRRCNSSFKLSNPLRLHINRRRQWKKELEDFVVSITNNMGASNVMNQHRINPRVYYTRLEAMANHLMDFQKIHLMKFRRPGFKKGHLRLYTDCIVCNVKTHRQNQREQKMKILVTSAVQDKRSLILAFHPLFDHTDIDEHVFDIDSRKTLADRQYDYLKHDSNRGPKDPLPLTGIGGYLTDTFYGYTAHFMVLKKLLKNISTIELYMDSEKNLYHAASTIFSDRIKAGSCDITIIKMEKDQKSRKQETINKSYQRQMDKAKKAFKEHNPDEKLPDFSGLRRFLLSQQMKSVNDSILNTDKKTLVQEHLATVYKRATNNPGSTGSSYWVYDKISDKYNPNIRMLWLTRREHQMNTEYELNLYHHARMFYIDNVFNAMRNRSSSAARPMSTASGHKNYNRQPELPMTLIRDFSINVVFWNFMNHYRSKYKDTIAYVHGLVKESDSVSIEQILTNKHTFKKAKEISRWLGT